MNRTLFAALTTVFLAVLAACGGGDTAEHSRTNVSLAALTMPTQAPVPSKPDDGTPAWDGSAVDLMFADALASCAQELNDQSWLFFFGDFHDDAFVEYVRAKMRNARCQYDDVDHLDPAVLPEFWWLGQRNDKECNRDASTSNKRSAGLVRADLMPLAVPIEPPFDAGFMSGQVTSLAVRRAVSLPVTNLCIAQQLRTSAPGVSAGAALLLSAAEQQQLLALTKERAQMAMLQFAMLGRAIATPRLDQPHLVSNYDSNLPPPYGYPPSFLPMLQQWAQGGAATDEVLRKLGEDFATAVLLHVTVATELAQALTRTGAAHLPRGASVRDAAWAASGRLDAAVDTWGPGAWRQRALASLYGGDPIVEDSSGSTPWRHFLDAKAPGETGVAFQKEWPDVGDASFFSARITDPKVHQFLALAKQADALYLRKTDFLPDPMSRYECRDVNVDVTADYIYRATEAHLRTTLCSNFQVDAGALDSGTCQAFAPDNILSPSTTGEPSFDLWNKYRISLQHARNLAAHLKDLVGKECRRERIELDVTGAPVPTLVTFWNRGARDFSGEIASVTLPGTSGGDFYHLIDFMIRDRGLPETAGLYSRYSGFFIPSQIFPEADPATQGFSGVNAGITPEDETLGAEDIRLMGAIPALAATRDALMKGMADAATLVSPACERISLYFASAQPALETIEGAIGRSAVALLPRVQLVSSPRVMSHPWEDTLERKVVQPLAPSGSIPTHDLFVTFDPTQDFWTQIGTAAAEYKLFAIPDDPTIMDLARYPGSKSFGREIEAALAHPRRRGDVALTVAAWSTQGTPTTRVASAPLALPRSDEQWTFIVRKQTSANGRVEYAPLASHVQKFSLLSANTGQYLAFGGALSDLAAGIIATDPSDPAMPAFDGFGLPNVWLPPTDPALFGGNAGEDAVAAYLRKARASAEEATAAVKEALEGMLETQQDQAALAAEVSRSEKVAELEQSALCGSSTCVTAMATTTVSPGAIWAAAPQRTTLARLFGLGNLVPVPATPGRPEWDMLATCRQEDYATMAPRRRLDCIARNVLSPRLATPAGAPYPWSPPPAELVTNFTVRLLAPVVAAAAAKTPPSFSEYEGGSLQSVAVEQWTALRGVEDRIRAVIAATDAAIGSIDVYNNELVLASKAEAEMKTRCDALFLEYLDRDFQTDWSDETSYSRSTSTSESHTRIRKMEDRPGSDSWGSGDSWGQTPMTEGAKRRLCESYRDNVTSAAWRLQEAVIQASANIQSRAADFSDAIGRLTAASQAGFGLKHQADLAVARSKLEADLLSKSQKTSFGLYRQIHSFDAWRAKSLLDSARLSAAVARKAIESRFLVNLSDLKAPEPLVASPSSWADEVYEYDLDAPAAVGLSVGPSVAGGIYANRLVDYVGNLERFVYGFSMARPTSVAHDDTEVISLPGPSGLDSGALPGTDLPDGRAYAWSYFCPNGPNSGWRPAPPSASGTKPSETCGPAPVRPTRASLLFALDPWGRLHGNIADEPFEQRYNARWGRLALNLVGTGVMDCSRAVDPGACYSQLFVRYRLAHRPPAWITDAEASWRLMPIPTGRIEGAKALAAEQWLDPVTNAWSRPFVTAIARDELTARPLGGSYEVDFEIGPEVVLERIERVQLLASSSYWVKQH